MDSKDQAPRPKGGQRHIVVTLAELVHAVTCVTDDAAEVVAVVEHILRTRASATLGMRAEPAPAFDDRLGPR